MAVQYFFKLFNSIKETHEVDFAEMELSSLFGHVERVRNFADVLNEEPLSKFTGDGIRIQDVLLREVPYGECQGFRGVKDDAQDVSRLARRLAYISEVILVADLDGMAPSVMLERVFTHGVVGKNVEHHENEGLLLVRIVTNQYFLEKSFYISKLSRNEEEIDRNVDALFSYPFEQLYRIPATQTMAVGKRLEDYFTIREEPSLHLTHYMHPYKGKFHPKMVRALLNYIYPRDEGLVMDNFAGSGTLLVEATLMGLDSIGVEINPLSVLMSNVKCYSLSMGPKKLKRGIETYLENIESGLSRLEAHSRGSRMLTSPKYDLATMKEQKRAVPKRVLESFKDQSTVDKVMFARQLLDEVGDGKLRNFLLLGLSGAVSDLSRRTNADFVHVMSKRLGDLYRRIYLFERLNQVLKVQVGDSVTYVGDARDMKTACKDLDGRPTSVSDETIDGIVNSPPYSTALDYIRNDLPQLTILGIAPSIDRLEREMMGNPNLRYYPDELAQEIENKTPDFERLPQSAKDIVLKIMEARRKREALRSYKFFKDMYLSILEMHRVLKKGAKAVVIIGNNHYKLDSRYVEVKNDQVIKEMAEKEGFRTDKKITRELEKTMSGMIRYESVVILEKL